VFDESLLICSAGAITRVAFGLAIGAAWILGVVSVMPGSRSSSRHDHVRRRGHRDHARHARRHHPGRRAARLNVVEALSYE
jgi:ABC-type lipoprotein release transport system permease subunit